MDFRLFRVIESIYDLTVEEREDLTRYDLSVANSHIENYGRIYLDQYNHPMEVEDVEWLLFTLGEL